MSSSNQHFHYLIRVESPPQGEMSSGIVLSEGFDKQEDFDESLLSYFLLCRVNNQHRIKQIELIVRGLSSFDIREAFEIEALSLHGKVLTRAEKRKVRQLNEDEISFHSSFVGFKSDSSEAKAQAIHLIESAISKKPWQFWK